MHPTLIKAALKLHGITQADIARQCGDVSAPLVYQVIEGLTRSKRIELRIAAATQLPLAELWPQWHGPHAKPRRRRVVSNIQIADALRALAG